MRKTKAAASNGIMSTVYPLKNLPEQLAEINGFLCGFICSGIESEGKLWLESLLGNLRMSDSDVPLQRHVLIDLYKDMSDQMQSERFDLHSNLPQETLSLNTRAYALKKWCNGFLTGLQQAGMPIREAASSQDLLDTLESLNNISRLDLDKVEIRADDEAMFSQVTTYIELAVTQIYRILNHVKAKH